MFVSMRYKRSRGWTPMDVSRNGEKRFIEVKGHVQSQAIVLTCPKVDELRQIGARALLYIVTFCKG